LNVQRFFALAIKEVQQLRKNRRLMVQLIVPPTLALVLFGFALNPDVEGLRLGVADYSATPRSRELVDRLTANQAFRVTRWYGSSAGAERDLRNLELDVVLVIPPDFAESIERGRPAAAQIWIDAVNANSARIAQGYLAQAAAAYARELAPAGRGAVTAPKVENRTTVLYNPGNIHSWFFVTGVMAVLLFINSSLVSSALAVREKELGTIEQLLMSPAQTLELLLAKTLPVLLVAMLVLLVSITVSAAVFGLPQRGSWVLLFGSAALASLAGIGIGITVATFSSTQQQAQLLTFFLMPPMVLISGAFAQIETMPQVFQWMSLFDPLRYMVRLFRGIVLKGAGMEQLWPQLGALAVFSAVLYGVSAWRFRGQLR
jgi:ABC-2 type transport system permease protein